MTWTKRYVLLLASLLSLMLVGSMGLVWSKMARQAHEETQPVDTPTPPPHRAEMQDVLDNVHTIIEIAVREFPEMHPHWTEAQLDEPLLVHDWDGQPAYWKFHLRRDEYIVGFVDVNVETGEIMRFGTYGKPLHYWPDPPTAEEALERARGYLSRYADATFDAPFFAGPPEVWLIRVQRNGEVIARICVLGDEVWEWWGRSTPTPTP